MARLVAAHLSKPPPRPSINRPDVPPAVDEVIEDRYRPPTARSALQPPESNGWACQRALMARNNVVIDIAACAYQTTDQGIGIAGQIAAKVPI